MTQATNQTPETDKQFKERRSEHRQRVLKGGTIRFNQGYGAAQCTVRNLTNNGALLILGETSGVPKAFDFEFKNEKSQHKAIAVWRTLDRIGIRFD